MMKLEQIIHHRTTPPHHIIDSSKKPTIYDDDDRENKKGHQQQNKARRTNQSMLSWCSASSFLQFKHFIIIQYICIWTFFYLLVHHSSRDAIQQDKKKKTSSGVIPHAIFNTIVELIKMTFSIIALLFLRRRNNNNNSLHHDLSSFFCCSRKMISLSLQYLPVAILYALYNNLMFFNLKNSNHPSVYLVLSNSRLVMTAFAWQLVFNVKILPIRKVAILFILLGILAKDLLAKKVIAPMSVGEEEEVTTPRRESNNDAAGFFVFMSAPGTVLIVVQMTCSVMAGIYNEKMLKTTDCHWLLQNVSMYIDSVVINLVVIASSTAVFFQDQEDNAIHIVLEEVKSFTSSPTSIMIVLTLATAGIMASMVLRHRDSVTKSVASGAEMVLTSFIEYFFFDHYFMAPEIIGIVLVTIGSVLYSIPASTLRGMLMTKSQRRGSSISGSGGSSWSILKSSKMKRTMGNLGSKRSSSRTAIKWLLLLVPVLFIFGFSFKTNTIMRDDIHSSDIPDLKYDHSEIKRSFSVHSQPARRKKMAATKIEKERLHIQRVSMAEEVIAFIVHELNKINAPVSIMYGSMLHEYRNGTGPTVLPNVRDIRFDIAVFRKHFFHVVGLRDIIEERFGYTVDTSKEGRLLMILFPPGQKHVGKGFQIDIYGFDLDMPRKGLIHFPWDGITVAMNSFLPLVKHKPLSINATAAVLGNVQQDLYYYMPFNVPCLLSNLYGDDYMTPKKGYFIEKEAYDNPRCDQMELTVSERSELTRQLSFGDNMDKIEYMNDQKQSDEEERLQIQRVNMAEKVIAFIVHELNKINAPVSIMYGSMLHEYRNGTGPTVLPNIKDKDFDIAVFRKHFFHVVGLRDIIEERFGYKVFTLRKGRLLMILFPPGQKHVGKGFQIDIYGFDLDMPRKGLIHFPWDGITVAMNSFLPLVKHKPLSINATAAVLGNDQQDLHYYMPFNVPCLLSNLYGDDYMTPKKGHFIQKEAYDNPRCDQMELTVSERSELTRQLSFGDSELTRQSSVGDKMDKIEYMNDQKQSDKDITGDMHIGAISCIRSREDVISALELMQSFQEQTVFDGTFDFEFYHYSSMSPYLIAKFETWDNVKVINVNNHFLNESSSCFKDALLITSLHNVVLLEPSTLLLWTPPAFNGYIQNTKKRELSAPRILCKGSSQRSTTSIASMSLNIDEELKDYTQKECNFHHLYSYRSSIEDGKLVVYDIIAKDELNIGSSVVPMGFLYISKYSPFVHLSIAIDQTDWTSNYDIVERAESKYPKFNSDFSDYASLVLGQIEKSRRRYKSWMTTLLLDRPVGWVAYDGGLTIRNQFNNENFCSTFNTIEGALGSVKATSGSEGGTMLNIDLLMSSDYVNIAMHNSEMFGPLNVVPGILQSADSMSFADLKKNIRNPCLPQSSIYQWFDRNPYRSYTNCEECSPSISTAEEFVKGILLSENDVDVVFDLKSSDAITQDIQALQILSIVRKSATSDTDEEKLLQRINVRYFTVKEKTHVLEVLPQHIFEKIMAGDSLPLKVYVNAPSDYNCLQLLQWGREKGSKIAGCFAVTGNDDVTKSWQRLSQHFSTNSTFTSVKNEKRICDVPRNQTRPNTSLWKNGIVSCVEEGFDWIHHPFPVNYKADHSVLSRPVLTTIINDRALIRDTVASTKVATSSTEFKNYVSSWGITSPYHWRPANQEWSFVGNAVQNTTNNNTPGDHHIFRCVTKIITVMLFFRLEELGLLSIDDAIDGLPHKVTWKQVFSNTAGQDGKQAGNEFHYSNGLWSHAANFIQNLTGAPFEEVAKYHVLDPLGLSGSFDRNTAFPPFAARGFVGSNQDLLVLGSTLASGGVSPKTRMRVISPASVNKMLHDWTVAQNVTESFHRDETVTSMKRFVDGGDDEITRHQEFFPYGVVDGYGMGLWRVNGWHMKGSSSSSGPDNSNDGELGRSTTSTKIPIRGWLAMGSSEALLYFDEDDIVVGMSAKKRVNGLEMTAPFAKLVRNIGYKMTASEEASAITMNKNSSDSLLKEDRYSTQHYLRSRNDKNENVPRAMIE